MVIEKPRGCWRGEFPDIAGVLMTAACYDVTTLIPASL
jgi:hypothetical protein